MCRKTREARVGNSHENDLSIEAAVNDIYGEPNYDETSENDHVIDHDDVEIEPADLLDKNAEMSDEIALQFYR